MVELLSGSERERLRDWVGESVRESESVCESESESVSESE